MFVVIYIILGFLLRAAERSPQTPGDGGDAGKIVSCASVSSSVSVFVYLFPSLWLSF